jgi:serine/threonine protein kinase
LRRQDAFEAPIPVVPGLSDLTLVGVGGMGAVYRAVDDETGALRAVKLLRMQAGTASPTKRFRREFNAVARLRHPGIVAVYKYGVCEQGEYIIMEWVPGGDLWHVAGRRTRRDDKNRALPLAWVPAVLAVSAQICEAMAYLHAHRILSTTPAGRGWWTSASRSPWRWTRSRP